MERGLLIKMLPGTFTASNINGTSARTVVVSGTVSGSGLTDPYGGVSLKRVTDSEGRPIEPM